MDLAPQLAMPHVVTITCQLPQAPWYHVPVGIFAVLTGVAAATMALKERAGWIWKGVWLLVIFVLTAAELRMIVWGDSDAAKEREYAACQMEKSFQAIETEGQQQFSATTGGLEGVIGAETTALVTGNKTLMQTMGGYAYPKFYVSAPLNHNDDMWPVFLVSPGSPWPHFHILTSAEKAPLIDVTVDISEILQPDFKTMTVSGEAFESQVFPQHYSLGTILVPETRTAPFKLQAGKNYQLHISTRRREVVERIYFDRDEKAIGGWRISQCVVESYTLYRRHKVTFGTKTIDGVCEN
jgi:hypothetical protein